MPGRNRRTALTLFGLALALALVLFGVFLIRSDARAIAERAAIHREVRESFRILYESLHPGQKWTGPSGAD